MKTFYLLLLMLGYVQTSVGQGAERVAIQSYTGVGIFKVIYKAKTPNDVHVTLQDSKRATVFTEIVPNTAAFSRPYNLYELPTGKYFIVIEDKEGKVEKEVAYEFRKVTSNFDIIKVANAVNKFLLSVENKEPDHILVRILDHNKDVIHEETLSVNGKFAIVYNLSQVTGTITFEVSGTGGEVKVFTY